MLLNFSRLDTFDFKPYQILIWSFSVKNFRITKTSRYICGHYLHLGFSLHPHNFPNLLSYFQGKKRVNFQKNLNPNFWYNVFYSYTMCTCIRTDKVLKQPFLWLFFMLYSSLFYNYISYLKEAQPTNIIFIYSSYNVHLFVIWQCINPPMVLKRRNSLSVTLKYQLCWLRWIELGKLEIARSSKCMSQEWLI